MLETIVKTIYLPPLYDKSPTGITKIRDDFMYYVVAGDDGSRTPRVNRKPKYSFYVATDDPEYHHLAYPLDKLREVECEYNKRHEFMSKELGLFDAYRNAKKDGKTKYKWISNNLLKNPKLYLCDIDIEDMYKLRFNEKYGNNSGVVKYRKSFMDIEVRSDKNLENWSEESALVPICSICQLDESTETIHIFVLNDDKVPRVKEVFSNLGAFVDNLKLFFERVKEEAKENILKDNGNPDSIHSFKFKYKFTLCNTEEELIQSYFKMVRETHPDFCCCWGIHFDMITIMNRAHKLGLNMADLISDENLPPEYRHFSYIEDHDRHPDPNGKNKNTHFSRYWDKILSTSRTQYYCQMSMHSNLRKRFLEDNYKLDTIAKKYAYINKYDLKSEGYDISTVYSKNFDVFLKYAIMDVVVQYMLERANSDLDMYMTTCKDTRFTHGHMKTFGIKNELYINRKSKFNEIIGNSIYYDISEDIPGAIVASPDSLEEKGIEILGSETMVFKDCVDYDAKSEYPNHMRAYNINKTTIWGRALTVFTDENINGICFEQPLSDGAHLNRMLETIDTSIFDIGNKYFGLPNFDEILDLIEDNL